MKVVLLALSVLLISLGNGRAADAKEEGSNKTVIIDIPTDLPPPASAEQVDPTHPFFSGTSIGNEVMEEIQELKERIEKLEKSMSLLEKGKN